MWNFFYFTSTYQVAGRQSDKIKTLDGRNEFAKITVSGYILGSNSEISNV